MDSTHLLTMFRAGPEGDGACPALSELRRDIRAGFFQPGRRNAVGACVLTETRGFVIQARRARLAFRMPC